MNHAGMAPPVTRIDVTAILQQRWMHQRELTGDVIQPPRLISWQVTAQALPIRGMFIDPLKL